MSALTNGIRLLFSPVDGWNPIAAAPPGVVKVLLTHTVPLALIPAACWYIGVTQVGWEVGEESMRLTAESALPLIVLFYLAMVFGVVFLGFMVHWMSETYGDKGSVAEGVTLITYTATPFFVAGLLGLYPLLWLDIFLGVAVACYCIYLLYTGVSTVMHIGRDRGFLYASAVFAVALVSFVGLLTATALFWGLGIAPEYTG
jgi:hypothetical protein